jgi:hypothetical protein
MNSFDIAHVPPPDPENYWWFDHGQKRLVGTDNIALQLIAIDLTRRRAMFNLWINGKPIRDYLNLDAPCVAIRVQGTYEPMLTVTLRAVEENRVALQVTANPKYFHEVPADSQVVN